MPGLDTDVLVIGGGPAGSAAAITAARAGLRVVVVDKARFPRDKCCGDGLTTGALRRLEHLGLRPRDVASWQWTDDVYVRSCSGRVAHYPLPRPPRESGHFAAVARRVDLDAALLDLARDAGAKVHEGATLTALRAGGAEDHATTSVSASIDGLGEMQAGHVIAADGAWSPARKLLSATRIDAATMPPPGAALATGMPYLGEWHAYRQYFAATAVRDLWVWFEPDILPGYVWAFPLPDGGANVGFGVERRDGGPPTKHMKSLWPQLLARPHIASVLGATARPEGAPKAWPIPASVNRHALTDGRVLFVGDAARACDVLTGEGIGQALQTGIAAGGALRVAHAGGEPAGSAYVREVMGALGPDHRMALLLQRAMRRPWVCRGAVRLSGASDWTRRNFGRWLFEDYPRGIAFTPGRWRRGTMSGPGPFGDLPA